LYERRKILGEHHGYDEEDVEQYLQEQYLQECQDAMNEGVEFTGWEVGFLDDLEQLEDTTHFTKDQIEKLIEIHQARVVEERPPDQDFRDW
jgi:hypothetical protein